MIRKVLEQLSGLNKILGQQRQNVWQSRYKQVEFDAPLTAAGFEKSKIFDEWRSVKILQQSLYTKMVCLQFREKILCFWLLVHSGSNSPKQDKEMLIRYAVDVHMQKMRTTVFASKNTSAENIATTDVQASGKMAQCSAMEENSGSDKSDSEFDIDSESSSSDSEESGGSTE